MKKNYKQSLFVSTPGSNNLILAGFFLIRLLPFFFYLTIFGVQIAPDSGTYRYGFFEWEVLKNHRGYGITAPFTILPNDYLIVLFQFAMVTFAGIILIKELLQIKSSFKYIAIICVFAVLNSPTVAIWDVWILSHSLSIAYNILSLTFLIKYHRLQKFKHLYAFGFFVFLSSISRPNNQSIFTLIVIFLILHLVDRANGPRSRKGINPKILVSIYLIVLMLTSIAVNSHLEKKWSPKLPVAILPYILDSSVPMSSDLIRAAKADVAIPDCAFPTEPLLNDNGNYLKNVYIKCQAGVAWLEGDFKKWYLKFLLTEPKTILKTIGYGTSVGLGNPTNYGDIFPTMVPEPILKLFMGAPKVRNEIGTYPLFGWLLLAIFVSVIAHLKRRASGVRNDGNATQEVTAFLISWLASAGFGMIYQSAGDNFRVFIDNQVIIIITTVYLVTVNLVSIYELSNSPRKNEEGNV
jgi:hypothetical protein